MHVVKKREQKTVSSIDKKKKLSSGNYITIEHI